MIGEYMLVHINSSIAICQWCHVFIMWDMGNDIGEPLISTAITKLFLFFNVNRLYLNGQMTLVKFAVSNIY